jgi:transglutaminase-like putative cysteine protease
MMSRRIIFILLVFLNISFLNAQDRTKHFITDAVYRGQVNTAFDQLKTMASGRATQLFGVFSGKLSLEEEEALKFLFAYMPPSDLADYDGIFYLKQVRMSLLARESFSWGKTIPEDIFRHFVLPYRINNENLDSSRVVFFYELKDRIKNLSMADAALEVNHWCHEKVNYKGTDGRTSAPLSTIRTAYGRCGEESTFTVTAMRAVGIPARQVYTPRWAHCDDNHAWVEVWIAGKWHFLGACEPESGLDMAWFAGPVLRAMLCNTTVYGNYQGPEEQLKSSENFTQINLIQNYAPTKELFIKAVDEKNKPLENAVVEFQLYNYAEFYTLAKKNTDKNGMASLVTGLGDLMIWAYIGNSFGFQKVTIEKTDTLVIVIHKNPRSVDELSLTFVPPVQRQPKVPDAKGKDINDRKLKYEDSLRTAYIATFIDSVSSMKVAKSANLDADSVWTILKQSRGNWPEISRFIMDGSLINKTNMYQILKNISEKDLHDTPEAILMDHLKYSASAEKIPKEFFWQFVLNPRIAGEILSPYKKFFNEAFSKDFIQNAQNNPSYLIKYINSEIKISATANYSRNPLTPKGTYNLKYADAISRDIYFVALCRSFGIPAMVDPATKIPQYYKDGKWNEVYFEKKEVNNCPKGNLLISYDKSAIDFTPVYYTHFTIAKFADGIYRSLDYEESPAFNTFPATVTLDSGRYMIVTGIRNNDGSVNTHLVFFVLHEKEEKNLTLNFITKDQKPETMGKISMGNTFREFSSGKQQDMQSVLNGKGLILAWIDPDREPTKHTMLDFQQLKESFEKWGGGIVFLLGEGKNAGLLSTAAFQGLPQQIIFGMDDKKLLAQVENALHTSFGDNYPVFLVIDAAGNILDYSSGYKIGRGEQIVKLLKYLK